MKIILTFTLLAAFLTIHAQDEYHVSGTIKGGKGKNIYLSGSIKGNPIKDSFLLKEETFSFSGRIDEPSLFTINLEGVTASFPFFLENSRITINGTISDLENSKTEGSTEQIIFMQIVDRRKQMTLNAQLVKEFRELQKNRDSIGIKRMDEAYKTQSGIALSEIKKIIVSNPDSYAAMYILDEYCPRIIPIEDAKKYLAGFSERLQTSIYAIDIKRKIGYESTVSTGRMAPDFTQTDNHNKPFTLSSLRGKFVLLDFWASWCKPCRLENPNLVKAYDAYKNKAFEIVSVSLDQPDKKAEWLKAISADNLSWINVSDLQFWNNSAAKKYEIQAIPANFLLDPTGKIIAVNLRGEELDKVLSGYLKK